MAGPIQIESFLTVERTMVNTIMRRWREEGGAELIREIAARAKRDDFDGARAKARLLNFDSVVDQIPRLETIGMAAILLGESFFSGGQLGPKGTGDVDGRTDLLTNAAQALALDLQFNGARLLQEEAQAMVDSVESHVDPVTRGADVFKIEWLEVFLVADLALASQLNASIAKGAERVVETGSNLTTSRLTSLGAMDRMGQLGAKTYQITEQLDAKTCPICLRMHGRIFETAPARDSLIAQLSTQNPQELKTSAPFPDQSRAGINSFSGMSDDQLGANGWTKPPFHPHCRGVLVPVGTVPRSERVPFKPLDPDIPIQQQTARDAIARGARKGKKAPRPPIEPEPQVPKRLTTQSKQLEDSLATKPKARQAIDDLDELYDGAAVADVELQDMTRALAEQLEGEALFPPGLKGRVRAIEKAETKYGGDFSALTDLSRASLQFDDLDDVYRALDAIRNTKGVKIVRFNDRFVKPTGEGYRDMILNLEMGNGHIVELQLHVRGMPELKEKIHRLYERQRSLVARAKKGKRDLTLKESKEIKELVSTQQELYTEVFRTAL